MTTILEFCPVWLNDAATPSDKLFIGNTSGLTRTKSVDGDFRRTASGRTRLVRQPGKTEVWSLELFELTSDEEDWLTEHLGSTLCFRDDRGSKIFGAFLTIPLEEVTFPDRLANVNLTVNNITFSEAV